MIVVCPWQLLFYAIIFKICIMKRVLVAWASSSGIFVLRKSWKLKSNASVNPKPDPPGDPWGFARSHCPEDRVFAQLSLPGGRGFKLEKFM